MQIRQHWGDQNAECRRCRGNIQDGAVRKPEHMTAAEHKREITVPGGGTQNRLLLWNVKK